MTLEPFFDKKYQENLLLKVKTINVLLENVKSNLTADLLKPEYREKNKTNPMFGHCYVATETIFHILKTNEYYPYCAKDDDGIVHWWLESESGHRIDATKEQYTSQNKIPPYDIGKKQWFLTKNPSNRSKELISRIMRIGEYYV